MIELSRLVRLLPQGFVSLEETPDKEGVHVRFKRFDPQTGQELDPENSYLSWEEVLEYKAKYERELGMLAKLLEYRSAR